MSSAGRTAGFFSRLFKTKVHNEVSSSPVGLSDSSGTKRPTKLRIRAQYTMKDILWDMKHVRQPEPYRSILNFKDPDLINYFELFTDQSMGGSSTASFLHTASTALFEGNLVTELTDDMQDRGFVNIGYAAFKSVEISPPLDVDLYDAFQLKIRTDDRLYVAQIKSDSPYEEDMYQYVIPAPKESEINEWRDIFIPFDEFVLTSRGQIEDPQVPFDGRNTLHMGVLSAQRKSGPFRFEIEFWRAVRMEFIQSKKRYTLL